ncbi:hypothetical protein DM02DRAFT_658845 [Periconia macrospinosa]|uniref:Uncharacterized protein n=1 Tax=Periconia macrospinosa TaxID=97972 RepID=A0A2V1DFB6_9PLEO|nr:hypothetical protein DM02DRAFT_658845 [Periconia macrospinosa]
MVRRISTFMLLNKVSEENCFILLHSTLFVAHGSIAPDDLTVVMTFLALSLVVFAIRIFTRVYPKYKLDASDYDVSIAVYGYLGGNSFSQPPGPELDKAWHRFLAGMNIVVSPKWLDLFGAGSVRLVDNSGVLAQLGVYHELHCLKKLKYWNY